MKDRIPLHAGRVQLVPVSGNLYDMSMADEPTEAGTPLNKANLLSDAAAAAVWPDASDRPSDPVPSEAFIKLGGKSVLLANYTTTAAITRTTPITFTLIDDVENFDEFEIWAVASMGASPSNRLCVDIGSAADENARLFTLSGISTSTVGAAKAFLLQNDSTGHIILQSSSTSAVSGTGKLTGRAVTLSNGGVAGNLAAGARVVIIGYKF